MPTSHQTDHGESGFEYLSRTKAPVPLMPTMPHMSQTSGTGHHNSSSNNNSSSSNSSHHQSSNLKPVKMKRTRQRVDAGEPRNSYASIANFSSRGGYHGYNTHKYGSNQSSGGSGGMSGNHGINSNTASLHHHNSINSSNYHHQQQSMSMATENNPTSAGSHHLSGSSIESMLTSKHHQQASISMPKSPPPPPPPMGFSTADAASVRPELLLEPAFYQLCQNQMAAILNSYAPQTKNPLKPFGGADIADQFPLNPFYNANALLSQLQTPENSLANIMNNVESFAAAAFLNQSVDAQLLREILEAGCGGAGNGGANDKSQHHQHQQQQQQSISSSNKVSHLMGQDHNKSKCSTSRRFSDSECNKTPGEDFLECNDSFGMATPGATRADDECNSRSEGGGGEEARAPSDSVPKTLDLGGKVNDGDEDGVGADNLDTAAEEAKDDDVDEAEANDMLRSQDCGSGNDGFEQLEKEAVKKSATRDGNFAKEERTRARGRPPVPSSHAQQRAKSGGGTLASGSTSSSAGGTSLGEETSLASFHSKNVSCADVVKSSAAAAATPQPQANALKPTDDDRSDSNAKVSPYDQDFDNDDSLDDSAALSVTSEHSLAKRARVENIVSNMLLVTNNSANSTPATSPGLNSIKQTYVKSDDDTDNGAIKPPQGVNGCKKRKLYQPQQSSKIQSTNGTVDTEDDDEEDEVDDDDEMPSVPEIVEVGVEAELDEGYEDEERQRRLSPKQCEVSSKELDLSTPPTTNASSTPRTHTPRSDHLPTKRARLSDYDNGCNKILQSKLFQKYTMQLYNEQQQQQQQHQQSKALNGSSHYPRTSPVNMSANADCDMNAMDDEPDVNHKDQSTGPKHRQNGMSSAKIYDVDLFVDSVTSQILSILGPLIESSFRRNLEAQSRVHHDVNKSHKSNDILTQMLEANFPRTMPNKTSVASPNTITKNSSRGGGSPFALPNEASPAPKPFSFTQSLPASFYGKQPFYHQNFAAAYSNLANSRDPGLLLNSLRETPSTNSSSSNLIYSRDDPSPLLPEQTEAISLVVAPKKRRNKVTDTRLTPRTITRLHRDENRDIGSLSPPMLPNGQLHFPPQSLSNVPVSLASLQHANDFFDQSATAFPFVAQSRLSSFLQGEDSDLKLGLINGVNGSGASNNSVVSAVAQATAAHIFKGGSSPDSLNGYHSSILTSYGRGSGTGSENGCDGSETNDTQSVYDSSMPMISFSQSKPNPKSNSPLTKSNPSIYNSIDYGTLTSLHTSTLSPMHLRKAKLMFFYVRYPSSSVLKAFFPDIKFNKNNTAQLVKWFSNFREFYYIQMEKYARQALSEGVKNAEDLNVTDDCELLRVLNLHYNRSNHIPIPENFRSVSEITLHEFYRALQQNKDSEQSWKKAIYKVIARLDDNVPEYFKNPNFIEQID